MQTHMFLRAVLAHHTSSVPRTRQARCVQYTNVHDGAAGDRPEAQPKPDILCYTQTLQN
jgi:hypothetical protein